MARVESRRTPPQEEAAAHEQHTAPLAEQSQHERLASQNKSNFASENHGRPAVAATAKAGDFSSRSAVPARAAGAEYHAPAMSPKQARVASPGGNKGNAGKSNEGFRPFTPPSKTKASNNSQSQTRSTPHSQSQPKPSIPKQNSHKSSPPPRKQSAPPRAQHQGR